MSHDRGKRTAGVDGVKSLPPPNASPWHSPSPSMTRPPLSAASGSRNRARRTKDRSASRPWPIEPATPSSKAHWHPHGRRASNPTATAFAQGVPATMRWQRFSRPLAKKPNISWTPTSKNASILHLDASFKNPKEMSQEQQRPPPRWRERTAYRRVLHESFRMLYAFNSISYIIY
jgi:hypothetical protein